MPTRHWMLLFAIIGFAAALRFYHLGREDFWLDELHSLVAAAGLRGEWESQPHGALIGSMRPFTQVDAGSTVRAVWRTMSADSHPPLYFVAHHFWRRAWGDGEFAVRSLPAIFSLLSVVALWAMFREAGRSGAGLIAAPVVALAFSHLYMAQESRPYSLGMLWITLSYWLFLRIERRADAQPAFARRLTLAAYGLTVVGALLTHYFTALAIAGQAAYALIHWRGPLLRAWAITIALAAAAWCVLWGPTFVGQWDFIMSQHWLVEDSPDHAVRTLQRLLDAPLRLLLPHAFFQRTWTVSLTGAVFIALLLLPAFRRRDQLTSLLAFWFMTPLLTFAAFDIVAQRQLLSHLRYPSVSVIGLGGLVVLAADRLRPRVRGAILAVLCAWMSVSWIGRLPAASNPASRQTAHAVQAILRPDDLLLFDAVGWPSFWASQLCLQVTYYMPAFRGPAMMLRDVPSVATRDLMRGFARIVCVAVPQRNAAPPIPPEYELVYRSEYLDQIGFIEVYEDPRRPRSENTGG